MLIAALFAEVCTSNAAYGWTTLRENGRCASEQSFDGPGKTSLIFEQDRDLFYRDVVALGLHNDNWSIDDSTKIEQKISLVSDRFRLTASPETGEHRLIFFVPTAKFDQMAETYPSYLEVIKGEQVISRLDLAGFYLEYLGLVVCRRKWEKERSDQIRLDELRKELPLDPFAKSLP